MLLDAEKDSSGHPFIGGVYALMLALLATWVLTVGVIHSAKGTIKV
jgi:hypothetical protein